MNSDEGPSRGRSGKRTPSRRAPDSFLLTNDDKDDATTPSSRQRKRYRALTSSSRAPPPPVAPAIRHSPMAPAIASLTPTVSTPASSPLHAPGSAGGSHKLPTPLSSASSQAPAPIAAPVSSTRHRAPVRLPSLQNTSHRSRSQSPPLISLPTPSIHAGNAGVTCPVAGGEMSAISSQVSQHPALSHTSSDGSTASTASDTSVAVFSLPGNPPKDAAWAPVGAATDPASNDTPREAAGISTGTRSAPPHRESASRSSLASAAATTATVAGATATATTAAVAAAAVAAADADNDDSDVPLSDLAAPTHASGRSRHQNRGSYSKPTIASSIMDLSSLSGIASEDGLPLSRANSQCGTPASPSQADDMLMSTPLTARLKTMAARMQVQLDLVTVDALTPASRMAAQAQNSSIGRGLNAKASPNAGTDASSSMASPWLPATRGSTLKGIYKGGASSGVNFKGSAPRVPSAASSSSADAGAAASAGAATTTSAKRTNGSSHTMHDEDGDSTVVFNTIQDIYGAAQGPYPVDEVDKVDEDDTADSARDASVPLYFASDEHSFHSLVIELPPSATSANNDSKILRRPTKYLSAGAREIGAAFPKAVGVIGHVDVEGGPTEEDDDESTDDGEKDSDDSESSSHLDASEGDNADGEGSGEETERANLLLHLFGHDFTAGFLPTAGSIMVVAIDDERNEAVAESVETGFYVLQPPLGDISWPAQASAAHGQARAPAPAKAGAPAAPAAPPVPTPIHSIKGTAVAAAAAAGAAAGVGTTVSTADIWPTG